MTEQSDLKSLDFDPRIRTWLHKSQGNLDHYTQVSKVQLLLPKEEYGRVLPQRLEICSKLVSNYSKQTRDYMSMRLTGEGQELSFLAGYFLGLREAAKQRGETEEVKKKIYGLLHAVFNTSTFDTQVHTFGFRKQGDDE